MRSFRSLILTSSALLAFGCDASVMVQGRVYRQIDPPASARGEVLIGAPQSRLPPNIEPLAGANITLYRSEDGARRLDPNERAWRDREVSAADGSFTAGGACAGGSYHMAVTVQREGCLPLVQRFPYRYEHPEYEIAILLVCPGMK